MVGKREATFGYVGCGEMDQCLQVWPLVIQVDTSGSILSFLQT